jgi:hypothetical protein
MIKKLLVVLLAAAAAPAAAQTTTQPAPAGPAAAPPAKPPQATPQIPPPETLIILTRSAVLALHHANATGNYTVLRDLGAPAFQSANSAARLAAAFTTLREQRVDLSPVALLVPQLTHGPAITQQGLLDMAGFFTISPVQINFEVLFQPVEGQWRLFGLSVNSTQFPTSAANAVRVAPTTAASGDLQKKSSSQNKSR